MIPLLILIGPDPSIAQTNWTTPVPIDTLTPNPSNQGSAAMAIDDSGNIVVVWSEYVGVDPSYTYYVIVERSTDQGRSWTRTMPFTGSNPMLVRDLVFDHTGTLWLLCSYEADPYSNPELRLSRSSNNGQSFTTGFSSIGYGGIGFNSKLAADRANNVYMLWDDRHFKLTRFLGGDMAQRIDTNIPTDTLSVRSFPSLVVGEDHSVFCLWEGSYYQESNPSGYHDFVFCSASRDTGRSFINRTKVDTTEIIGPAGSSQQYPSAAMDSSGNLLVTYDKVMVGRYTAIHFAKSIDHGQTFAVQILTDTGSNYESVVCSGVKSEVNVVWSSSTGSRYLHSTDGGTSFFSAPIRGVGKPALHADRRGNLYVVFDNLQVSFARKDVALSIPLNVAVADNFRLFQNYPNPFNPSTTITFELPRAAHVRLTVYDVLGREVSVLVNDRREAGVHEVKFSRRGASPPSDSRGWRGSARRVGSSTFGGDGSNLASGVYFYRLTAGGFVHTRKFLLLR